LATELASRGAHIIALSDEPVENSPGVEMLVELLRSKTDNHNIYAEHCDMTSPTSVRAFCTKFLTGQETRLDAIVYAHEYQHVGSPLSASASSANDERRRSASLGTFLMTTLLLPVLLVAPPERDIRIITVVNPFYAAAVHKFSPAAAFTSGSSVLQSEGLRSLRNVIFTRHLQRVLDALPNGAQVPSTEGATNAIPVASNKQQRSNIVTVSVSPGISRQDTVAPLLDAHKLGRSRLGLLLYVFHSRLEWYDLHIFMYRYLLFQPIFILFVKSSTAAVQSVLHALFLPTPFKNVVINSQTKSAALVSEEVLKPGALYAECAVVRLQVPPQPEIAQASHADGDAKKAKDEEKETPSHNSSDQQGLEPRMDDGELGGEVAGQLVWESFEVALREWDPESAPKADQAAAAAEGGKEKGQLR
jgi:NAD(P)-dependent dehydrogenase (short-subunit alcohol dehydrogenase family)